MIDPGWCAGSTVHIHVRAHLNDAEMITTHVPFVGNVRYVAPFLVLVFPFSAAGAGVLARGFRGRRRV